MINNLFIELNPSLPGNIKFDAHKERGQEAIPGKALRCNSSISLKLEGKETKKGSSDQTNEVIWGEKQWKTFVLNPSFTQPCF